MHKALKGAQVETIMAANNAKQVNVKMQFNVTFGVCKYKRDGKWVTDAKDKFIDAIPANAAVLVNECKKRVDGELREVVEFMAVEGVKSTKNTDLVMPILAVMLADARTRGGFASEYKVVTVGSKSVETKLTAKSAFTKWLKGNVVYKSNTQGALNKALVLDEGLRLRNTALRVTEKQGIYDAKGDVLRVLMHKTAEAICKQANMFSNIMGEAKAIFEASYATPKKKDENTEKAA